MTSGIARLAVFPAADGPSNFARDDALFDAARRSGSLLACVYAWTRPTISFGRNERTAGWYSRESVARAGFDAVRRRTGGRALLHDRELTYAIAGPASSGETLAGTYAQLSDILVAAMRALGVAAHIAPGTREANREGAPCFATTTRGEIVVDGRKLVASAQWRSDGAFLQHGSILIDDTQDELQRAVASNQLLPPAEPAATLRELMSPVPTADEFGHALLAAIETFAHVAIERVAPSQIVDANAVRHGRARYADPAWTWRR